MSDIKKDAAVEEQETVQETAEEIKEEVKEETPADEVVVEEAPAAEASAQVSVDSLLRNLADCKNQLRHAQEEKAKLYDTVKAEAVKQFLPVYDNLVRALANPTEDEAYRKGVEMIMTQFNTTLEKLGVKEIPALGEQFDPNFHNAVMHVEQDGCDDNTVVEVFQKGFISGEKVIRHAIVKVAN